MPYYKNPYTEIEYLDRTTALQIYTKALYNPTFDPEIRFQEIIDEYGPKIDFYVLDAGNKYISLGIRYGDEDLEYLSVPIDVDKKELLNQEGEYYIYRWDSELFADYGLGSIMAVGKTIEEARENARRVYNMHGLSRDEDRKILEEDIKGTPDKNLAWFETGSA
jgi:hypothetical protein